MNCKDCRHWQGRKYDHWGDCYCVLAILEPKLLDCYMSNEYGTITRVFNVPFDPHEIKYWINDSLFRKLYNQISFMSAYIRLDKYKRDDIVYDYKNGERIGKLWIKFFQTHRDFGCWEYYNAK